MEHKSGVVDFIRVTNGSPGKDGVSLYTWIKYADSPTEGMSDSPLGKKYIGIAYNKTTLKESNLYKDYDWSLIKGDKGLDGTNGKDGINAQEYYVETNQPEVLKYVGEKDLITPKIVVFEVLKMPGRVPESNFSYKLEVTSNQQSVELDQSDEFVQRFLSKGRTDDSDFKFDEHKVFFDLAGYVAGQSSSPGAKRILEDASGFLKLTILNTDMQDILVTKMLPYRNGLSKDMAELNVNAADINAAVQSTKLKFDANGLEVKGGGLVIKNKQGDTVLDADTDGNLIISGKLNGVTGTFSGSLEAASGSFSGSVTANDGQIGGFSISRSEIKASGGNLVLNGSTGLITAGNIFLEGGEVTGKIKLGKATLCNPNNNGGKILQAGGVSLSDNGALLLGSIKYDPNEGILQDTDSKWQLKSNGQAIFNEVIADNVIQKNSILEIGTVQSVGSLMLFKDSWVVTAQEGIILTVDPSCDLKEGDWISSDGKDYYKVQSNDGAGSITLTSAPEPSLDKKPIMKLGQAGKDYVLSALGSTDSSYKYASGNSITLAGFQEGGEDGLIFEKRLVLGDLSGIVGEQYTGFGLYCDNVFLKGSLTTKSTTGSYAGINTASGVSFDKNLTGGKINDESAIIFWAGADENTATAIRKSPFQVTEKGTIYARQAYLTESIFIEGTIKGADIYGARLHGSEINNELPALSFYDTKNGKGISFRTEYVSFGTSKVKGKSEADKKQYLKSVQSEFSEEWINSLGLSIFTKNSDIDTLDSDQTNEILTAIEIKELGQETFSIKSDGFRKGEKVFIQIGTPPQATKSAEEDDSGIAFIGEQFQSGPFKMSETGMFYNEENFLNIEGNDIGIGKEKTINNKSVKPVMIKSDEVRIDSGFKATEVVTFGDAVYLQYRQVNGKSNNGYDLYVYG